MTGYDSEQIAMEALARGAVCYVPKHKLPKELVDTADNILAMAEHPRRAQPAAEPSAQPASPRPAPAPPPARPQARDECWMHTESYYRLPNDPACLMTVLPRLQDDLRRLQLCDSNSILRVAVAVREALSNAIVHGNLEISAHDREANPEGYHALLHQRQAQEPYCKRRVHLLVRETWDEVCYRIRDEGPGFDPTTAEPANPANLNQDTGRGLRMIKTFMDEVRHNDQGNEITLVKRRAGG
jgi:anti-sigma regulatory factor (Ser/Thr protein kinase)